MYILESMQTRLQRWGNSLGLRIPKAIAEEIGVEAGSIVEITIGEDNRIVVAPVTGPHYELRDLLAKITTRNRHAEVPAGRRRGREVW